MKRTLVTGATALALLAGSVITGLPAQAAVSLSSLTLTPSGFAAGSALETGVRYTLTAPYDPALTGLVGSPIATKAGKVDLTGVSEVVSYRFEWLKCGARGAGTSTCTVVGDSGRLAGSPGTRTLPFVPTPAELGGYLRARVTTYDVGVNVNGTFVSPAESDILIVPPLATGSRPSLAATIAPDTDTQVSLGAWALASGTTFSSRLIQAFTCPSADAGQTAASAVTLAGCAPVPAGNLKTPVTTAGASVITLAVPANANGSYLVVQDTLLSKTAGGSSFGYQTRSSAGAIGVTPTPSPSPMPSASATPTPTPTVVIPVNPSANSTPPLRVSTAAVVKRGTKVRVSVVSSFGGTGEVKIAMRSRPSAKGKANTRTVIADASAGAATVTVSIPRTARKGAQYWYVVYVDDETGTRTVTTKKVTVR